MSRIIPDSGRQYNGKTMQEHLSSLGFEGVPQSIEQTYGDSLVDLSATGKVKPWGRHKSNTMLLSESFERLHKDRKAEATKYCGHTLKFNVCPAGHEKRLKWASFCRVRLCPMCAWRRSLKVAGQVKDIAHVANGLHKIRWLFLTLTCKNVSSDDLPGQLDILTKSFKRLFERKIFKSNVLGFFRALEVTYDSEQLISTKRYKKNAEYYDGLGLGVGDKNPNVDTYHPHLHVLLAVRPSYFGEGYIKQNEWVNLWRDSMRADYNPVVDIRIVKGKRDRNLEKRILREKGIDLESGEASLEDDYLDEGAVSEISKYSTKSKDYIFPDNENLTDKVVLTFEANLNHRRLFAFGGILKDIYENMKTAKEIDDIEEGRLDPFNSSKDETCQCSICKSDMLEELYRWVPSSGNYLKPKE